MSCIPPDVHEDGGLAGMIAGSGKDEVMTKLYNCHSFEQMFLVQHSMTHNIIIIRLRVAWTFAGSKVMPWSLIWQV